MAGTLVLTHGLVASGKSTWAKKQKEADPQGVVLVERDEIRETLFGAKYHTGNFPKKSEDQVTQVQQNLIKEGLKNGKRVIVSDTNLNRRFIPSLVATAKNYGAKVEQEHFNVPVEECKRRNKARGAAGGREVPEFVIDRMAAGAYSEDGNLKEFVLSENGSCFTIDRVTPGSKVIDEFNKKALEQNPMRGNAVVLVDVDGTLANNGHHAAYAFGREGEKKDFPFFFRSLPRAPVNKQVRDLANRMRDEDGLNIVIMTGRDDSFAKELVEFVDNSGLKVSRVIAKRDGDFRPDNEFKTEQLQKLLDEGLIPVHSIDDRPRSIAVWERAGIMVSRVDFSENEGHEGPYDKPFEEPSVNTIYGSGYCIRCGSTLKSGGNIGPKCKTKL